MKKNNLKSIFPKPIFLGAATRTPIGGFGGSLSPLTAPQLAFLALKHSILLAPEVSQTDWVFLGHARQAGCGPNTARQATILSGLSNQTPAITFNQACASGLASVLSAAEKIALGRSHSIWAGGVESMSNTPFLLPGIRWGYKSGNQNLLDAMIKDGFMCPMAKKLMGETVEDYLVKKFNITRKKQDEYSYLSHKKSAHAWTNGLFNDEICSVNFNSAILEKDEHIRVKTSVDSLAKLNPVFDSSNGTITAGNSCGIADGAAFLHVSDTKYSHTQAELLDFETIALDPKLMGLGPVDSINNLLKRNHLKINDVYAYEVNEAFAAQVLACQTQLKIPEDKLNINGGAIAMGHPIGATGTRMLVTLIHLIKNKPGQLGIASLCVSGGQGVAVLIRSV